MRKNCVTCLYGEFGSEKCDDCVSKTDAAPSNWKPASFCKPDTKADCIRAMSDEELAEYFGKMCVCTPGGDCNSVSGDCKACWLELFQQPAEEVPCNG